MTEGQLKDKVFYSFKDWHQIDSDLDEGTKIEINNGIGFLFVRKTGKHYTCTMNKFGVKKDSWRNQK